MPNAFDVVIVGTGHAGAQAAISLRQGGFEGSIALIGEEDDPPYERPPLSKDYLGGNKGRGELLIRPAEFWPTRNVALHAGRRVEAIRADAHEVVLKGGEEIGYRHLIWAGGGTPRPPACPGSDLDGVHVIRTRGHVDDLLRDLDRAAHVVVVGGGYIGLEAAATLSATGKRITVLEMQNRLLSRVTGVEVSRFIERKHRDHGVEIRLGARLQALSGPAGRVSEAVLADGRLPADVVIVGIGLVPSIEPLVAAGAACGDGVEVDEHCRTNLPDVYAIGDCARHRNLFAGGIRLRLESVQNAVDQARIAAATIMGLEKPNAGLPLFWSQQYDVKLQTVGLSHGHDQALLRGDPDKGTFSVLYLREGHVIALDCINAQTDFVQGRELVKMRAAVDPALVADASVPLRACSVPTAAIA